MAVDEVLLEEATQGTTTLRLYQWNEPTLSLGYFQPAAERAVHAASRGCPLVRRASGGGAIMHDRELTYCLATPIPERFGPVAQGLFDTVHAALIETLAGFGVRAQLVQPPRRDYTSTADRRTAPQPFLCFQRRAPGDVLVATAKIAGSAQRRQRGGLLQHGSILLARSQRAPELPGIEELTGAIIPPADLARDFSQAIANRLRIQWTATVPSDADKQRALALERKRFAASEWTTRR